MAARDSHIGRGPRISRRTLLKIMAAAGAVGWGNLLAGCGDNSGLVVAMNGLEYAPARMTVKVGDTVTWRNLDRMIHTMTCDPAKSRDGAGAKLPAGAAPWDSGDIEGGEYWRRTFDVPGEYIYFCIPHELAGMVATLTVEE